MTATPETQPIVIDLERSDHNREFAVNDLVHLNVYEALCQRIAQDLAFAQKNKPCPTAPTRPHAAARKPPHPFGSNLVYFIDGSRGAGKTTFLRTAYEALNGSFDDEGKLTQARCSHRVQSLAYIDPTRLENTEVLLLRILERIKTRIEQAPRTGSPTEQGKRNYFENAFNKLAPGLALFGRKHDPLENFDPDLFFAWGLERNAASHNLRRDFHELVDHACDILKVDALVLAFDDADTDSSHAMRVLECVRKYLDTPQLVVLLTGDMELYSLLVRKHFYGATGDDKDPSPERTHQRNKMVEHLEDQYLLKLFPMQRRFKLPPLHSLVKRDYDPATSRYQLRLRDSETQTLPLREAVEQLLRKTLRLKSTHDVALFRDFLLGQPMRSVVQLLSRCFAAIPTEHSKDLQGFLASQQFDRAWAEVVVDALRGLALGPLYKMQVDADRLSGHDFEALAEGMFNAWLQGGADPNGIYFLPDTGDNSFNAVLTALSAEAAWQCAQSPANSLRLMLQGMGTTTAYGIAGIEPTDPKSDVMRRDFRRRMAIGQTKSARHWTAQYVGLITDDLRGNATRTQLMRGCIGTSLRKGKSTMYIPGEVTLNSLTEGNPLTAVVKLAALTISGTSSNRQYVSIFTIMGLIEALLRTFEEEAKTSNFNEAKRLAVIEGVLSAAPKSVITGKQGYGGDDDDDDIDETDDVKNSKATQALHDTEASDLAQNLCVWLTTIVKDASPYCASSSALLGNIWRRLDASLSEASHELRVRAKNRNNSTSAGKGKGRSFADIMEIYALCVIHAFFVEELEHHWRNIDQNLNSGGTEQASLVHPTNPLSSRDDYIKKLDAWLEIVKANHGHPEDLREVLPLTAIIASCPLVLGLISGGTIARSNSLRPIDVINKLSSEAKDDWLCDAKSFQALNTVRIAGEIWQPQPAKKTTQRSGKSTG